MKKDSAKEAQKRRNAVLGACERTRQACNQLTDDERRRLREKALAIIYGRDAKVPARRR
jgi:hypothetical protein